MGEAIPLGACLTGLQGFRGPLGWEPAEAAVTNNVVSKATGVDIAHREPDPTEPAVTTTVVRRRDVSSQGASSHGAREDDSSTTSLSCITINYTTLALADCLCLISVHSHT